MPVKIKKILVGVCSRCGQDFPLKKDVKEIVRCGNPKCRTPYWNKKRTRKINEEVKP